MVLGISNKLGFHASRHTFGVLMLNEDIPIGSIAKMMGHADITSTQVYAQVTEQKISNDMDKLIAKRERNRLSNEKLLENEQRSYNYQRERNSIHADRYCMDDHAGDCRHV